MTSKPCRGYQSLLDAACAHDVVVAALARTRQHVLRRVAAGLDVIVAQGTAPRGHTGEAATMVLVPKWWTSTVRVPTGRSGIADLFPTLRDRALRYLP